MMEPAQSIAPSPAAEAAVDGVHVDVVVTTTNGGEVAPSAASEVPPEPHAVPSADATASDIAEVPVEVVLRGASVTVRVAPPRIRTIISPFTEAVQRAAYAIRTGCAAPSPDSDAMLPVLAGIDVVLASGSSTLVLAPPGAGATTLLRMVAGLANPDDAGSVLYNGAARASLEASGVALRKLALYNGDEDIHEPLLTVRETLDFAYASRTSPDAFDGTAVQCMLKAAGLVECADTRIGNSLFRGVSGGEKRRASLAEALLLPSRVLCLDGPTDGLDAVTAREVMEYVINATRARGGVLLAALHGVGTETFKLFDNLLLLAEGRVVYYGPTTGVDSYLASVGLARPSYIDTPDWCMEAISDPASASKAVAEAAHHSVEATRPINTEHPQAAVLTVEALQRAWQAASSTTAEGSAPQHRLTSGVTLSNDAQRREFGHARAIPLVRELSLLVRRQFRLAARNWLFIALRMANCIVMAAILGTVFLDAPDDGFSLKYALGLFAVTFIAFINNAEIPMAVLSRGVVYKQTAMSLYSERAYSTAVMIAHVPLTAFSDVLFCAILYYIAGYQAASGRFFFFYLLVLCQDFAVSVMYRSVCYWTPSQEIAMTLGSAFTAVGLSTGGFFVLRNAIPRWMVWLLYISPFFWCVTAIANNEYRSPEFGGPFAGPGSPSRGEVYLSAFDYPSGDMWQWGAIIFLLGLYLIIGCALQPVILRAIRRDYKPGARRADESAPTPSDADAVQVRSRNMESLLRADGVEECTLAFQNVEYAVAVRGQEKPLLRGVTGWAAPRTMTALMGASGAGKTTLLDCLAYRKTTGRLTGAVHMNGVHLDAAAFARVAGYVEQTDIHAPLSTVREALAFACRLRLARAGARDDAHEAGLVDAVMDLLDLTPLADRLVGGLARGQLKVLSIGVEMVACPSVLFLDEPTTGADARAAHAIIRAMRRVAASGRTVICTIHQPSPAVFFSFDNLLLLAPGGHQVYFGPLGTNASALQAYLERVPGVTPLPPATNPAVWMLECAGEADAPAPAAGVKTSSAAADSGARSMAELAAYYSASANGTANAGEAAARARAAAPAACAQKTAGARRKAGPLTQLLALVQRAWLEYARNPSYNTTRGIVLTLLGVFFGMVYYSVDQGSFTGLQSAFGSILAAPGFVGVILFTTAMPHAFTVRDVIYRESAVGTYRRGTGILAYLLVEVPYVAAMSLVFTVIFYFMLGFRADAATFWMFALVSILVALTYQSGGTMMAGIMPNIVVAQVVGGMTLAVYFLFGGVFIAPRYIIRYWKWMYYCAFESWAVRALSMDQWFCDGPACSTLVVPTPSSMYVASPYALLSGELQFSYADRWRAVGALAGFTLLYAVATIAVFHALSHVRR